jgi:hypothetical protein
LLTVPTSYIVEVELDLLRDWIVTICFSRTGRLGHLPEDIGSI